MQFLRLIFFWTFIVDIFKLFFNFELVFSKTYDTCFEIIFNYIQFSHNDNKNSKLLTELILLLNSLNLLLCWETPVVSLMGWGMGGLPNTSKKFANPPPGNPLVDSPVKPPSRLPCIKFLSLTKGSFSTH